MFLCGYGKAKLIFFYRLSYKNVAWRKDLRNHSRSKVFRAGVELAARAKLVNLWLATNLRSVLE